MEVNAHLREPVPTIPAALARGRPKTLCAAFFSRFHILSWSSSPVQYLSSRIFRSATASRRPRGPSFCDEKRSEAVPARSLWNNHGKPETTACAGARTATGTSAAAAAIWIEYWRHRRRFRAFSGAFLWRLHVRLTACPFPTQSSQPMPKSTGEALRGTLFTVAPGGHRGRRAEASANRS